MTTYELYTAENDSTRSMMKINEIKSIKLDEIDEGDINQLPRIMMKLTKRDSTSFWVYKSGLLSIRDDQVRSTDAPQSISKVTIESSTKPEVRKPYYQNYGIDQAWN